MVSWEVWQFCSKISVRIPCELEQNHLGSASRFHLVWCLTAYSVLFFASFLSLVHISTPKWGHCSMNCLQEQEWQKWCTALCCRHELKWLRTTGRLAWVFVFSLIGLAPLAERVSFLSEHIADTAGPTAGGLLNATCGNVPELIIALFALHKEKLEILKWSLLGSILSNLLLVLGSSLLLGGLANAGKEHPFDRRQADVSIGLLMLGVLCHILPVLSGEGLSSPVSNLELSRLSAIIMVTAYFGGLVFQLKTHRQIFEQEEDSSESSSASSDEDAADNKVMGFASAVIWLIGMAAVIAMLSNYVIITIEEASESLGIPVRFVSIILLPIVGNAAEHAGAIIFAFKNKIDITLGIALGSATQISLLVIPVILIVSWVNGIPMDLNLNLLETGSLVITVFTTAFTLQDDKWHYLKGFNLTLCYVVIAVCFFSIKALPTT